MGAPNSRVALVGTSVMHNGRTTFGFRHCRGELKAMTLGITGIVESGYENVAETFSRTFRNSPKMGAALSVRVEGETVLDVWGGCADSHTEMAWSEDTSSVIFSSTKGLLAILACILIEEQQLHFDSPVVRYWPEFGKSGKSEITIRQLLSH